MCTPANLLLVYRYCHSCISFIYFHNSETMQVFYNLVFVATLAIAAPEYRDTLNLGDANDIPDQKGEVFSGQPQNFISNGPNPPPSAESDTDRSDIMAFSVPDTVNNVDNNPSQEIAATLKHDEPGQSPDKNKPSPPLHLPQLQDTSHCTQLTDGCIPDQRPFRNVDKVQGVSCRKVGPTTLGDCRVCNQRLECASASFKCFWLKKEQHTIDLDPSHEYERCHLCIDFWTSKKRCSFEEIGEFGWIL